jgi:hypothetical protein
MIASASSLVAAVVVSKIWGGGTLVGAAVTPVIVALVSEGLRRPAQVVTTVRETRSTRFDPIAEGRQGLREGDLARARPAAAADPEARFHRPADGEPRIPRPPREPAAPATTSRSSRSPLRSRRAILAAVATGLIAFIVAGVVLTGSELVFGSSAVTSSDKRTTLLGGQSSEAKPQTDTTTDTTTTETTTPTTEATTTPTTDTTTTPAPTMPQEGTVPAAPPAEQTAPAASPAPTPPPPAGTGPTTDQPPPATTTP